MNKFISVFVIALGLAVVFGCDNSHSNKSKNIDYVYKITLYNSDGKILKTHVADSQWNFSTQAGYMRFWDLEKNIDYYFNGTYTVEKVQKNKAEENL